MTTKIAIASQKGGCGKSAITLLLANMLFFQYKKRVLIFDCDTPQNTCAKTRQDEMNELKLINSKIQENKPLSKDEKEIWKLFKKSFDEFPTLKSDFSVEFAPNPTNQKNVLKDIPGLIPSLEKRGFDIIFFDTVGSLSDPGPLLELVGLMDYVFVPIEAEAKALKPAMASLATFNKIAEQTGGKVWGFFNKFKIAEKDQIKAMMSIMAISQKMSLPLLIVDDKPLIMEDKACFRSPIVQSTFFSAIQSKPFVNSEGYNLLSEMCNIILK